jgi:hypothetical protein
MNYFTMTIDGYLIRLVGPLSRADALDHAALRELAWVLEENREGYGMTFKSWDVACRPMLIATVDVMQSSRATDMARAMDDWVNKVRYESRLQENTWDMRDWVQK